MRQDPDRVYPVVNGDDRADSIAVNCRNRLLNRARRRADNRLLLDHALDVEGERCLLEDLLVGGDGSKRPEMLADESQEEAREPLVAVQNEMSRSVAMR